MGCNMHNIVSESISDRNLWRKLQIALTNIPDWLPAICTMVKFELNCVEVDDSKLNDARVESEQTDVNLDEHKEPLAISQVPT